MGAKKNKVKILKSLEARQAATPNKSGFKKPGSMNRKKTGYAKVSNWR